MLRSLVPTSQILFGSDYDRFPLTHGVDQFARLELPGDVRIAIENGNARRLFKRWQ
jgi:predicted TIM-barrel fold metal-dependent hydrolase